MREVFHTREEANEGTALLRRVIPQCAAKRRIRSLQSIDDGPLRDGAFDFQRDIGRNTGNVP
jgi:hypothetical protein